MARSVSFRISAMPRSSKKRAGRRTRGGAKRTRGRVGRRAQIY